MTVRRISRFLWAGLLAWSMPALAEEDVIIGVEELDLLPYYSGASTEYRGFARELLDNFAVQYDLDIQYKSMPLRRLAIALQEGEVDLRFPDRPAWRNQEMEEHRVYFSLPVMPFTDGFMVRPGLVDHTPYRMKSVGRVRGFALPKSWRDSLHMVRVHHVETDSLASLLDLAEMERTDAVYFNRAVFQWHQEYRRGKPSMMVFDPVLPSSKGNFHLSTVHRLDLLEKFDEYLTTYRHWIDDRLKYWEVTVERQLTEGAYRPDR
ncbi:transporter substrate-binding domain-containing protein [Marinobacteraceae bacterium S3BR75-40.1]